MNSIALGRRLLEGIADLNHSLVRSRGYSLGIFTIFLLHENLNSLCKPLNVGGCVLMY